MLTANGTRASGECRGYPQLTLQNNHMVNLTAGQFYTADFGVAPAVDIRGMAYDDLNANGQRDTGENGLSDVTMYVDLDQNGVLNTHTPSWPRVPP